MSSGWSLWVHATSGAGVPDASQIRIVGWPAEVNMLGDPTFSTAAARKHQGARGTNIGHQGAREPNVGHRGQGDQTLDIRGQGEPTLDIREQGNPTLDIGGKETKH